MKFKLEIFCNNASFEDHPNEEVARILRETAQKLEDGRNHFPLLDANGNRIGQVVLE